VSIFALSYEPEPDTGCVLDRVEAFLRRFVAFPSEHCLVAATLWAAHTHVVSAFESTPRLALLSPEPGSGKSRVLEVLELLVPRPLHAINATPAALFRKVSDEAGPPTILFDEVDTLFGPKAKDNEDVRGMLNAGHRRGATALRCVVKGKTIDVEEFPAFCAVALAGLGDLPDTLMTRSVVIRMRRRGPGEQVEAFRHRIHRTEAEPIREELERWADSVRDDLQHAWPKFPDGIEDRAADVWEALLAVADVADGDWPDRARVAAVALVALAGDRPQTLGLQLLSDLRTSFNYVGAHLLSSDALLEQLCALDESPWADLRGKPLDARGLARMLRKYDVTPKVIRVGNSTPRGYDRADLEDVWARYLPTSPPGSATSATAQQGAGVEDPDPWPAPDGAGQKCPVDATAAQCIGCGQRMTLIEPGQLAHPACSDWPPNRMPSRAELVR